MAINYDKLMSLKAEGQEFSYGDRETMLYALGIGFGRDPMDEKELPFVYEKNLKTVPTLATVVAWGAGAIGFLFGRLNWVERVVAIVSASFLVVALPLTDEIGLGAVAVFLAWHWWRTHQLRMVAA